MSFVAMLNEDSLQYEMHAVEPIILTGNPEIKISSV
jgi:hypothetical protein